MVLLDFLATQSFCYKHALQQLSQLPQTGDKTLQLMIFLSISPSRPQVIVKRLIIFFLLNNSLHFHSRHQTVLSYAFLSCKVME